MAGKNSQSGGTDDASRALGLAQARRRENQQRFVERRKAKLQGLETKVEELQQELQALELEKAHDEAQLAALAEYVGQSAAVSPATSSGQPSAEGGPQSSEHSRQAESERSEASSRGTAQLSDEGAATLAAMLTSIRGAGAPGTTPAECKHVTPSFLADFNVDWVRRLRALLQLGADVNGSPAHDQLNWLMEQYAQMYQQLYRASPVMCHAFTMEVARRIAAEHGPAAADDVKLKLVRLSCSALSKLAMQLTDSQRRTVAALTRAMMRRLDAVSEGQRALAEQLSRPSPTAPVVHPDPAVMSRVRELVGEMQAIQMEFGEQFWAVLRPVQHARGLTATSHTIFDLNALGIEVVAMLSEPGSMDEAQSMQQVVAWVMRDAPLPRGFAPMLSEGDGLPDLPEGISDLDPADLAALLEAEVRKISS